MNSWLLNGLYLIYLQKKAITQEDITLFHNMMSKYSCYEHSQPIETPISLPDIADLEADLVAMEDWAKEYDKRCEAEARKARGSV